MRVRLTPVVLSFVAAAAIAAAAPCEGRRRVVGSPDVIVPVIRHR